MTNNAETMTDAVVLKPTGTVQIANRFSLVERKLLNTLMYYAQQRRFAPQEHSLPVAEVFYHIGLESSRNHDVLKAAIRKLTGTVVEWNIFGDDRTQEWGVCTFLASGKLARGKIRFRINPEIIDQITMTETALEECEAKVHKAVAEDDEARLARSGRRCPRCANPFPPRQSSARFSGCDCR